MNRFPTSRVKRSLKRVWLTTAILVLFYQTATQAQNAEQLEKSRRDSLRKILKHALTDSPDLAVYKEALVQLSGLHLSYQRFDSVFATTAQLQKFFPQDPAGYLLEANACQSMMRDYRVRIHEHRFERQINKAIELAQNRLKEEKTAQNFFTLGSAEGYLSLHQFRKGQWLQSLKGVIHSLRNFRSALSVDPEFVDPLLGLALYEYAKSRVPLLKGDLDKARNYLVILQEKGQYVSENASFALQMIYFHTEEFEKAFEINEQIYYFYPTNPVCLYNRALLFEKRGDAKVALSIWQKLKAEICGFEKQSQAYLAECHYHFSKLYFSLGDCEKAKAEIGQAITYLANYRADEEIDGPYETVNEIKDNIEQWRSSLICR